MKGREASLVNTLSGVPNEMISWMVDVVASVGSRIDCHRACKVARDPAQDILTGVDTGGVASFVFGDPLGYVLSTNYTVHFFVHS